MLKETVKGLSAHFLEWSSPKTTCLLYHRVLPLDQIDPSTFFSGLVVATSAFEEQLKFLSRNRTLTRLKDIYKPSGIRSRNGAVGISFDDGYLDNFKYALPLLEKYEVPATLFVSPQLMDEPELIWWYRIEQQVQQIESAEVHFRDEKINWNNSAKQKIEAISRLNDICKTIPPSERNELLAQLGESSSYIPPEMLGREALQSLAEHPLIDIGGHTRTHCPMSAVTVDEIKSELKEGDRLLSEYGGTKPTIFAYPFGHEKEATEREYRLVEEHGYQAAFTTITGHITAKSNKYALPRVHIDLHDSLAEFRWKISRSYPE